MNPNLNTTRQAIQDIINGVECGDIDYEIDVVYDHLYKMEDLLRECRLLLFMANNPGKTWHDAELDNWRIRAGDLIAQVEHQLAGFDA